MDFGRRLLLGLMVLAVMVASLQIGLGYFNFKRTLDSDLREDLVKYSVLVANALELKATPKFYSQRLVRTGEFDDGRFRLLRQGVQVLQSPDPFPLGDATWMTYRTPLGGYSLEVALNLYEHHRALSDYLRTAAVSLPLSLVLAIGVAIGLQRILLRPLRELKTAVEVLALERSPTPLREGSGELGQLARNFNRMARRIQQALEREKSFTLYASHELRTSLTVLGGYLNAYKRKAIAHPEFVEAQERSLLRAERILSGLLDLTRVGGEQAVELSLGKLVSEAVAELPAEQQVRVKLMGWDAKAFAPKEALLGAVRNLLSNALKYTDGGVWLGVEPGPPLRITVRDEGPGVPQEAISRLGQPFFQAIQTPGGLGLGLAYSKRVMELMGGSLEMRNLEKGFEATLTLP